MGSATGRTGSAMSSRQIAFAAKSQRKIVFRFLIAGESIGGYVVGMDDYHWFVAEPQDEKIHTHLVSKGGAEVVSLNTGQTLADELEAVQAAVREIGQPFWDWCEKTFFAPKGTATTVCEQRAG